MTNTIRIIGAIVLLMISKFNVSGQYASGIPFTFTETISTPPVFPTTGAVNIIIPASQVDEWDTLFSSPLFSFQFAGHTYTKIIVSSNGWLALAPSQTHWSQIPPPLSINLLSNNTTGFPIIAPLWDDLSSQVISYNITGGSLWVRWTCKWNKLNVTATTSLFWIKLDMSDYSISFYYANNSAYVPTSPSASIGIAGVCPGDFYSVFYNTGGNSFVDSTSEDTTIGALARPYNLSFKFTPASWNDNCPAPRYLGTINTCIPAHTSTIHATTSGTANCGTTDVKDVWYSFYKPIGVSGINVMTAPDSCESVSGTTIEVYDNCSAAPITCATTSTSYPNFGMAQLYRSGTIAETLYVRVTSDGDIPGKFFICASDDSLINSAGYSMQGKISPEIYSNNKTLIIVSKDLKNAGAYEIFNMQGMKIKTGKLTEDKNEIRCDELPYGIYLVNVMGGGRFWKKVMFVE